MEACLLLNDVCVIHPGGLEETCFDSDCPYVANFLQKYSLLTDEPFGWQSTVEYLEDALRDLNKEHPSDKTFLKRCFEVVVEHIAL